MELPKQYDSTKVEEKIYQKWEASGYFDPDNLPLPADAPVFSIMMPPVNVTGVLHLGHALENAIMDTEIRYQRMRGKRAFILPGTDHAAVATQAKVEQELIKSGQYKNPRAELGREKLLKIIREYAENSQTTILSQIKKMGTSCDWSRLAYTFDQQREKAVNEMFIRMYNDGLIYRGHRVVNWSVKGQSTLSDDELEYKEQPGKLYTFKYSRDFPIPIATTRPETKLGDTAVAVNPDDPRYAQYVGAEFEIEVGAKKPLQIKVIADDAVDPTFGTGALGVTPAHSQIDFELKEKHGLKLVQIIDRYGRMTEEAGTEYAGLKVLEARDKFVDYLKERGLLIKEEEIIQNVGASDRFGDVVEVIPMLQWFVDVNKRIPGRNKSFKDLMKEVFTTGLDGDANQKIKITPERFEKSYFNWIDNLRDWCISRQIWWGHQIPVYYKKQLTINKEQGVDITYFVHSTTTDNQQDLRTGWNGGEYGEKGEKQNQELKKIIRERGDKYDVVFCSDLSRARQTAEIVFGENNTQIIMDARLRECNYGDLNGKPEDKFKEEKYYIDNPHPNGESYNDVKNRIQNFLKEVAEKFNGKKVAIVAHKAPQLAIESIINNVSLEKALDNDWRKRKAWQAGWNYIYGGNKTWDLKIYGKDMFQGLVNGKKTIEIRAGKPESAEKYWGDFKTGDMIEFHLADEKMDKFIDGVKSERRTIEKVKCFDNFEGLFKEYPAGQDYPGKNAEELKAWYEARPVLNERIKKYGLWVFELKQIKDTGIVLTFFRHTQTESNKKGVTMGRTDMSLNNEGIKQAGEIAEKIKERHYDLIFCSPLKRARETAEILFGKNNLRIDKRLIEIDFGQLTGKSSLEADDYREAGFPGGESYYDVSRRVNNFLEEIFIKYPGKKIAIVAHSNIWKVLENIINDQPLNINFLKQHTPLGPVEFNFSEIKYVQSEAPKGENWEQDPDTLDTWFSSGLWTFSTLGWPDKTDDLKKFHPTTWMQMGYEILFFWMARMILMSSYALNEIPFKEVYIHGMLRDKQGKKFSKSLGNGIDPRDICDKYGTDALRLSLISGVTPGNDARFYEDKVVGFRNFANKLWNIGRFIQMSPYGRSLEGGQINKTIKPTTLADQWIISRLNNIIKEATEDFDHYRFSLASEKLYEFAWHELADWYVEIAKKQGDENTYQLLTEVYLKTLTLLHPFMPFITEVVFESFRPEKMLMIEKWPAADEDKINAQTEQNFKALQDLITAIRSWRKEKNIEPKEILKIKVASDDDLIKKEKNIIDYLAKVEVESVDKLAECDLEVAGMKVKIGVI